VKIYSGLNWLRIELRKHGNDSPGFVKGGEFTNQLRDHQLLYTMK
jgi:hypothetical protein